MMRACEDRVIRLSERVARKVALRRSETAKRKAAIVGGQIPVQQHLKAQGKKLFAHQFEQRFILEHAAG